MDHRVGSLPDEARMAIAPAPGVAASHPAQSKPRGGWFLRPVGFTGALVGMLFAPLYAIAGDPIGALAMLAFGLTGFAVFRWAGSRDRRWRDGALQAALAAEHRWLEILATAEGSSGDSDVPVDASMATFLEQARGLRDAQLRRLASDVLFAYPRGRGSVLVAAGNDNVRRAEETRQAAIQAARSAIERHGSITPYRQLLDEGHRAFDDAIGHLNGIGTDDVSVARAAVEWSALAFVADPWITDDQFATLYGQWWRSVVSGTSAVWYAPWSTLSLAGFWLTVAGIICAAVVNRGDAGYISLGILVLGVAAWAAGATYGATHSVPWPAPARRSAASSGGRSGLSAGLHRIWRSPESFALWVTTRSAPSRRPKS